MSDPPPPVPERDRLLETIAQLIHLEGNAPDAVSQPSYLDMQRARAIAARVLELIEREKGLTSERHG